MGTGCKTRLSVGLLLMVLASAAQAKDCRSDAVELRGPWGTAQFAIELADDPQERAQGLMNRTGMGQWSGMLFVYPESKSVAFWMKNTLIPLDMIFVDDKGVVQSIHSNAQPNDETPIFGGDQIKAVLEINGGLAEKLGITIGSEIRSPVFAKESAAWPC